MADLNRRSVINWFLSTSVGAAFAAMAFPVFRFMSPPEVAEASVHQIEAGATNDPEFLDRGFRIIRFGADPVIVARLSESDFRAFAGTCTHLDCIVEFQPGERRLWCNCHNGGYDMTGRVTEGPPPHALEQFKVDLVRESPSQPAKVVVSRA